MACRYNIWYAIIFSVHLFSWYYALVFCSIYKNSAGGWLYGCFISIVIIDMSVMQFILPISKTLIRAVVRAYPNR